MTLPYHRKKINY